MVNKSTYVDVFCFLHQTQGYCKIQPPASNNLKWGSSKTTIYIDYIGYGPPPKKNRNPGWYRWCVVHMFQVCKPFLSFSGFPNLIVQAVQPPHESCHVGPPFLGAKWCRSEGWTWHWTTCTRLGREWSPKSRNWTANWTKLVPWLRFFLAQHEGRMKQGRLQCLSTSFKKGGCLTGYNEGEFHHNDETNPWDPWVWWPTKKGEPWRTERFRVTSSSPPVPGLGPGNMAEIRDLAGNDPELQDELLAQQRMIHEQQRCLAGMVNIIVPADDMGVVGHTQKNANSHVICKVKKAEKCISPVSSVKCLGQKSHMTWDLCIQKDARHVMSTNSHTVHFTSHMNKDSIWVYDYLLALGIIQNYTSAVRIFQSHMNPFTSLFYLAAI